MRKIDEIRELIGRDEIDKAIESMKDFSSLNFSDYLVLISSRYQKWKRDKRMGLGDNLLVRNAILVDFLDLLTELEKSLVESEAHASKNLVSGSELIKSQVFISYSHEDVKSLKELKRHFAPLTNKVNFWDDSQIEPGQKWRDVIEKQMQRSKIAILLVSSDFFNSDFIKENELPPLLKLAENNGVKILSLILKPCLWEEYPDINQYQAINSPTEPISSMTKNRREATWVNLVRTVRNIIDSPQL